MSQRRPNRKKSLKDELEEIDIMNSYVREQVSNFQFKINCKFKIPKLF